MRGTYFFNEQLLGHGHALIQALLVSFEHLLLLVDLPPQIAVCLKRGIKTGGGKRGVTLKQSPASKMCLYVHRWRECERSDMPPVKNHRSLAQNN